MARLFFDLLIIAAIVKEMIGLLAQGFTTAGLFLSTSIGMPFFLGMAAPASDDITIVRDPIRNLIRSGIAVVSLVLYLYMQAAQQNLGKFVGVFVMSTLCYLLGRLLGLAWKTLGLVLLILVVAYALSYGHRFPPATGLSAVR